MSKTNSYAAKARKQGILASINSVGDQPRLPTKNSWKDSGIELVKDLAFGVGAGSLLAAVVGRPSLLAGMAISFTGYMVGSRVVTAMGLGTMAYGTAGLISGGVSGTGISGVKERVKTLGHDFKYRLFLDKILKSKKDDTSQPTNGLGNVRYFVYPGDDQFRGPGDNPLDTSSLDRIQSQVEQSAQQYQQVNGMLAGADFGQLTQERIY